MKYVKHIKQQDDKEPLPLKPSRSFRHLPANKREVDRKKQSRREHKWEGEEE